MSGADIPNELAEDLIKPERDSILPLWIIVDSEGKLKGMHYIFLRFEYCRDVIIIVTDSTPVSG